MYKWKSGTKSSRLIQIHLKPAKNDGLDNLLKCGSIHVQFVKSRSISCAKKIIVGTKIRQPLVGTQAMLTPIWSTRSAGLAVVKGWYKQTKKSD